MVVIFFVERLSVSCIFFVSYFLLSRPIKIIISKDKNPIIFSS